MKIDEKKAEKILLESMASASHIQDPIGKMITAVLRGTHKTYKYVLFTALLAKSTDDSCDALSLQAKDKSEGAYDARSLCHHVVVPFERDYYPNSLGGSNEPYLNKPARFERISPYNAVRKGNDRQTLEALITIISQIKTEQQALIYLRSALFDLKQIYEEDKVKYEIPDIDIEKRNQPQTVLDFINALIQVSCEGEICPIIIATIENLYYGDNRIVVPHKVNESGASSKEVGDIDIFNSADELVSSIEVKDKDFTKEDVQHAINKFASAKVNNSLFIFGNKSRFTPKDVHTTAAELGQQGYFCSIVSIMDYARMRLYQIDKPIDVILIIEMMMKYAKLINAKDETISWIKECALELAL